MKRLRDLLDSDDPVEAEAARLVRAADELDPPRAAQARVRDALIARGWSGDRTAPAVRPGARPGDDTDTDAAHGAAATMIGPYRVTGALGQGRMAAVHTATHALLGRPAVIKVLSPELSQQRDIVQRFFNEARATTAIRHPGIVEIYDFGWTADGAAFIAMEQLDGETLAQRSRRGRLDWWVALAFARQIAGALGAAHARGIVHRDLTPGNVFLIRDREVPGGERIKLLDFGVAKLTGDLSSAANLTQAGTVLGTPAYMAPEQCRGVAVDHRADLYALGCVVYELITGRPPFTGQAPGDVLAAHIHAPVATVAPGVAVPQAVEQLIHQLLAKSPDARIQTADQLVRAIDAITGRVADVVSIQSRAPHAPPPSNTTLSGAAGAPSRLWAPPARRPGRTAAILAAAAAVAIIIAAARSHDSGPVAPAAQPEAFPAPAPAPAVPSPGGATRPPHAADDSAQQPARPPVSPGAASASSPDPAPPAPAAPTVPSPAPAPRHPASPPAGAAPQAPPSQPPSIALAIDSEPSGAEVVVAGSALGTTPLRRTLPRHDGTLTIVVRLAGYRDQTLVLRADRAITQHLTLVAVPSRAPQPGRDKSVNPFER